MDRVLLRMMPLLGDLFGQDVNQPEQDDADDRNDANDDPGDDGRRRVERLTGEKRCGGRRGCRRQTTCGREPRRVARAW